MAAGVEEGHHRVDTRARVVGNHNKALTGINRKLEPILVVGRLKEMGLACPGGGDGARIGTAVIRFVVVGETGIALQSQAIGGEGTNRSLILHKGGVVDPVARCAPVDFVCGQHQRRAATGVIERELALSVDTTVFALQGIGDAGKGGELDPIGVGLGWILRMTERTHLAWPFGDPAGRATEIIIFIAVGLTSDPNTDWERD